MAEISAAQVGRQTEIRATQQPGGSVDVPTETQIAVLQFGADGTAELELQTGLCRAAVLSSIRACERRGWIGGEYKQCTDAGEAALRRAALRSTGAGQ